MDVIIKTSKGEMNISYWADMEYKRVNLIMKMIEDNFGVSLATDYPELRHEILDVSNFIRRLPSMINEVVE